ncbi:MAG: hypothetical protein JSR17_09340, partial [Proteobacteria bacterium]|nr:hypothetical protein [Pseudomonadota bacterium]
SQVEAKDQAYRKFMGMVAKVQAFAKASENNNYYIQTCLSSMPCNLSAAQRQELINRVNTAPLTPAFTNQQPTASLNGAMSGHGDKGEQAEKTVAPKLK